MSGYQRYVAIDEFSLNVSKNGEVKTLTIKPGDALDFDGITVSIGGEEQGTAAALRKVTGEWIEAYNGSDEFLAKIQEKIKGKAVKPQTLRKVVANSSIEHSAPDSDNDISRKPAPGAAEEFKKIVNEEEKTVTVVNDDQREVSKVTEDAEAAETRSSSSVELSDASEEKKREIVSDEDSVAKKTNYDGKEDPVKEEGEKVSIEEDAVIETNYDDPEKTDISSSTQAQIEKTPAKAKNTKKASTKKKQEPISKGVAELLGELDGDTTVSSGDDALGQEGVVVKKGSKIKVDSKITDIEAPLTIGASDEGDDGAVTFSSNDTINDGEATFSSSGEDSPVEVSGDTATIIESDSDIDVESLLEAL